MNRAELRRAQREAMKKDKRYNLTREQLRNMIRADSEKLIEESTDRAFAYVLAIALLALRDEFGFGTARLERFCKRFNLKLKCAEDFTPIDTINLLEEETGINPTGRYSMANITDEDIKALVKECNQKTGMELIVEC